MALLDGRDEPLGRVDFALDELQCLAVLCLDRAVGGHHVAEHLRIAAVDAHLGDVARVEREVEAPVVVVEDEVRNDVGGRIGSPLGVEVARLGGQAADFGDGIAELLLAHLQAGHQLLVVLLDELVEVIGQDAARKTARRRVHRQLPHLQQQALAQVAGADAGRLQVVDDVEQPFELLRRGLDAQREGDVVGDGIQLPTQVAVLVDAPHQVGGQPHLPLREVAVAELLDQVLLQRTPLGENHRTLLVVLRIVVDAALVGGRLVLAQVFVDRNLLGLLLFGRTFVLLQHDVVLDFLLDALLELHGGKLQQLDGLNLLGRELLLKRKDLFLCYCHIESKLRISFSFGSFIFGFVRVSRFGSAPRNQAARGRSPAGRLCTETIRNRRAAAYAGRAARRGCWSCP